MRRMVCGAIGLLLAGIVAAGQPAMAPGWTFTVRRTVDVDLVVKEGNDQPSNMALHQATEFEEKVARVQGGRPAEVTRRVLKAESEQTNPETGKLVQKALCKPGSLFRVAFTEDDSVITDAATGQKVGGDLAEVLWGPLAADLWPDGELAEGRSWAYQGEQVTEHFALIEAQGGQAALRVEKVEEDPSGLRVARIRGTVRTKIKLETLVLDLDGKVAIDLALALGVPLRAEIGGSLSASGVSTDKAGRQTPYKVTGQGSSLQVVTPSQETLLAARKPDVPPEDDDDGEIRPEPDDGEVKPEPDGGGAALEPIKTDAGLPATEPGADEKADPRLHKLLFGDPKAKCHVKEQELVRLDKGVFSEVVMSDGGAHYAAVVTVAMRKRDDLAAGIAEAARELVVVDGKPGPQHDEVWDLAMSPDGQHVAYIAKEGKAWRVVKDGARGPTYDHIKFLTLSPDGRRVAYRAEKGGKRFVVVDHQEVQEFEEAMKWGARIAFSPDGRRVGFDFRSGGRDYPYLGDKRGPAYDSAGSVAFGGPKGERIGYIANVGKEWFAVIDGREERELHGGGNVTFSPDGSRVAYQAKRGEDDCIVVDGKAGPPMRNARGIVFSHDSRHLAFWACVRQATTAGAYTTKPSLWSVVVDGAVGPPVEADIIRGITFNPDCTRLAYRVKTMRLRQTELYSGTAFNVTGGESVVLDGKQGGAYKAATDPQFVRLREGGGTREVLLFLASKERSLCRVLYVPAD